MSLECVIPDEIKAMRPTISDQFKFYDVIAMEDKTIKRHLEEKKETEQQHLEEEKETEQQPMNKIIFMNEAQNQFVAVPKDEISKLIYVNGDNDDVRSGVNYKCKGVIPGYSIRPHDVEYDNPYFDLRSIGFHFPGGYIDLDCLEEALSSDNRAFMIVEPPDPIKIDPVANELSISTHSYVIKGTKTISHYFDDTKTTEADQEYRSGELNSVGLVVEMSGAVYCKEGQYSKLVYLVPVDVISAEEPVPSAEEPVPSAEEPVPSAKEPVPSAEGSVPGPEGTKGGKRKRKGKNTLRKKNLLKKKKNKTKRKKSKKGKKSKK